jgi:8-oxo-dGTP diphosphatase
MCDNEVGGIRLVVAGLLVTAGSVLLCHRSADRRWYPNVWDLPRGDVELGETPLIALGRELYEELGIHISEVVQPLFAQPQRPDRDCRIRGVTDWSRTPRVASGEHDEIAWWSPSDVGDVALADQSYLPLIRRAVSEVG